MAKRKQNPECVVITGGHERTLLVQPHIGPELEVVAIARDLGVAVELRFDDAAVDELYAALTVARGRRGNA